MAEPDVAAAAEAAGAEAAGAEADRGGAAAAEAAGGGGAGGQGGAPVGVAGGAGVPDGAGVAAGLAALVRRAGVAVATGSVIDLTEALALVGVGDRSRVHAAGRAVLVHRSEELAAYDRAFAAWWDGTPLPPAPPLAPIPPALAADGGGEGGAGDAPGGGVLRWSDAEVLRHRDLAALSEEEWVEAARLLAALRVGAEARRTRRRHPSRRRGPAVDLRRTVRASLRTEGIPLERVWLRRGERPRRLVVLVDVSGSMEPYARACLRFAQAAVAARRAGAVEVFALGTRLTRLTRLLAGRDPDVALAAATAEGADWSGGTRLGAALGAFNDGWGVRGTARGAVVVVLSDGWDRGDTAVLGAEMARLGRLAHRVVWVNPLKASPGYQPLAAGMAAALPHVDDFVEGHSLASLEDLAAVIGGRR